MKIGASQLRSFEEEQEEIILETNISNVECIKEEEFDRIDMC